MIEVDCVKRNILSCAYRGQLTTESGEVNENIQPLHDRLKKYEPVAVEEQLIEAPEHWIWTRIGYVTKNHGQGKPTEDFYYIDVSSIDNENQKLPQKLKTVKKEEAPSRARKIVEYGDVLYSTVRPYLRNICIVDREFSKPPIASTAFCVMGVKDEIVYNKWLFYWLLTSEFDRFANGNPAKGTLYPAISEKAMLHAPIPLPSVAEQHRIVEKLDGIFDELIRVEHLQKKYAADADVLRQKVIDAAMCGTLTEQRPEDGTADELYQRILAEKKRLQKAGRIKKRNPLPDVMAEEIPFEIPETWKWVRWGNLSENIQYGYSAPAKENGRIKMVRITDIQDHEIKWETVPYCDIPEEDINQYLLHENDILFARSGATVGKSYIVSQLPEPSVYAGYLIRTSYSKQLCPQYIEYFMSSSFYWKQLTNGTTATAQPNCNGKTLSKMILPLPPLAEQQRIVQKIQSIVSALAPREAFR